MSTASNFQPAGYHTVTPFVIVRGAAGFIDYLTRAFGAIELGRMGDDGAIGHAEVRIGDAVVMLFDAKPDWPRTPAFLRVYVADCDGAWQRAIDEGGESVTEPGTMPWGDRVARVRDPFGNLWWIQTRLEDLTAEQQASRWQMPEYLAAVQAAQDSEFFPAA
jgi:PhnB protein